MTLCATNVIAYIRLSNLSLCRLHSAKQRRCKLASESAERALFSLLRRYWSQQRKGRDFDRRHQSIIDGELRTAAVRWGHLAPSCDGGALCAGRVPETAAVCTPPSLDYNQGMRGNAIT